MPNTFRDLVGINAGKEWDQIYNPENIYAYNPLKNCFRHVRSFHLMEDDYPFGTNPANAKPDVQLPREKRAWGRMNNYNLRYKRWKDDFDSIRVSLSSIVLQDKTGKVLGLRKFPNGWYSKSEWGEDAKTTKANAKNYALAFFKLHVPVAETGEPLIETIEIGNEPWGDIGTEAYQAVTKGIIEAHKEYYGSTPRLSLSSGAFQAHNPKNVWKCNTCKYPSGDYVVNMLDGEILEYIEELTVHPYSFLIGTTQLTETPESESSDFSHIKSMFDFRKRIGKSDLKISVTEYGWDSLTVGEAAQSAYTLRNIFLMTKMSIHKAYFYEGLDNPGLKGLYGSSGVFNTIEGKNRAIGTPKIIYKSLLQLMHLLCEKHFVKVLFESKEVVVYGFGMNTKITHLVAWQTKNINQPIQSDQNKWVEVPNFIATEKITLEQKCYKLDGNIELTQDLKIKTFPSYSTNKYVLDQKQSLKINISPIPYVFVVV